MSGLLPRLRKRSAACFDPSEPSKTFKQLVSAFPTPRKPSNNLFRPFRPLGNLQATCLSLSDASETFKQLVSAFPTPRGVRNASQVCRVRAVEVPGQLPCPGRGRQGRLPSLPGTVFFEVPGQLPSPGRGRQGRLPSLPGTVFLRYPASFPAPAGDCATVCLQPPLATSELTTAKPPSLQRVRRSGGFFL